MCWGSNFHGQLGIATPIPYALVPVLVQVTATVNVSKVAAGASHSCAIFLQGAVACWGSNRTGQLGIGIMQFNSSQATSSFIPFSSFFNNSEFSFDSSDLSLGREHTCIIFYRQMSLYCWGSNDHGQLGDGSTISKSHPTLVSDYFTAVDAGGRHTCAIDSDGSTKCWGSNDHGQLGNGNPQLNPIRASNILVGFYSSAPLSRKSSMRIICVCFPPFMFW
jgi:alpha-tubulin suppressor-like RCC1 family protein